MENDNVIFCLANLIYEMVVQSNASFTAPFVIVWLLPLENT